MKNLTNYLKEEKKTVYAEIYDCAYGIIDYFYNEGVVAYDDNHLSDYADKKAEPDFKDLVEEILYEYKELSQQAKAALEKYLKGNQSGSVVETAILGAIDDYVEKGNCRDYRS